MIPVIHSLFVDPGSQSDEIFTEIATGKSFRLEHIESHGRRSRDGAWYDQDRPEWVALVAGRSVLEFEQGSLALKAGDSLLIPAHLRHRVASASTDATWLALHFDPEDNK